MTYSDMAFTAIFVALTLGQVQAAEPVKTDAVSQEVVYAGQKASVIGSAKTFTGHVRNDPFFRPVPEANFSVSQVTFDPGARSFWHRHPAGQRLVVLSGVGRTGTRDGKVVEIRAGDTVWCPPGVEHWHGATPQTGMTHMTMTGVKDNQNVVWLEPVTDAQYNALSTQK